MAQNISCGNCGEINLSMEEFCTKCGYELAGGPVNSRRITGSLERAGRAEHPRWRALLHYGMIGEGGFGAVYKATDDASKTKPCCRSQGDERSPTELKRKKRKPCEGFRNEADLLVQLKHPNLPKCATFLKMVEKPIW